MESKDERIEERTREGFQRRHENSFLHKKTITHQGYFIQGAVKEPGRVRSEVKREFGDKAFTERGTIKEQYLDKAIAHAAKSRQYQPRT